VDSYAERCGLSITDYHTDFYLGEADSRFAEQAMPGDNWIAIHPGPSTWRSKEWPIERFIEVIEQMRSLGHKIVLVGSGGRGISADSDQRGRTSIHQMAALIKRASVFMGLDSLPFHLAESVGTPAIGLFGITDPKFISTRNSGALCVCGTASTFGLRHRVRG